MKKLYRIVNYENFEKNKNDYYCEYSLDSGETWKVEKIFFTFKEANDVYTISEDILWVINKKIDFGYKFVGVVSSNELKDWKLYEY